MPDLTTPGLDFQVRRDDYSKTRFVEREVPGELAPGQVLFRVDRFALTSNNISYAVAGDMLRYWDFFPAEDGWGRIPAMGFADVVRSTHPDVAEGTRCFGFYPMSRYLTIEPSHAGATGIADGVEHRKGIAPVYNTYVPTGGDPIHHPDHEDAIMLMRGLFMTSWLVDDLLSDEGYYGADTAVVTSASSKTSIALAWLLHQAKKARVVGLTSARNAAFVRSLGIYDDVVLYEDLETLSADAPSVIVDMAGNGDVINRFHRHLGANVKYSCAVGATHWDQGGRDQDLPGAKPEFFFAPARIVKRTQDWGAEGVQARIGDSWRAFRDASDAWLKVVRESGSEALERVYQQLLAGGASPNEGHVLSLRDDG
jgi:NADPH:quinone reductase-like Zn-dependent oxidoreductase